jgi:GntR family transcriptional regulator
MKIHLNFQSPLPLYQQIAQQVAVRIAAGGLPSGNQLPTVRDLADELGIHFNTVSRAYQQLEEQGWTSSQPGRGTFVLPRESRRAERAQRLDLLDTLTRQYLCLVKELGFRKKEIQARISELEGKEQNR